MFNPKRVLRFWSRVLLLLLPLYASVLLLAFLATQLSTPPARGRQLGLMLAASLVPATLALLGGFILSTSYLQSLYSLEGRRAAFWHLVHCLFGQASFKPWLRVEWGKIDFQLANKDDFIVQVGGPGNVIVRKDSAVVLEKGGHLTQVEGPGFAKLEPFERVYDTVDLRPQRWRHPVQGLSKEGIPVTCETDVEFQIQDTGQQPSNETPFPADLRAVFSAVTARWIREKSRSEGDRVLDWKGRIVISTTEATLRFILARYPLDRLIAPAQGGGEPSRQTIRRELEQALHDAAGDLGAKILKVELGEVRVQDEVTQKWIEGWQADWDRWEAEYLATSEAAYLEMMGTAKAEALVRKIRNTVNVLHALRQQGEQEFIDGTKLQLNLAMRNIGSDSIALTYMPAEAMRLLQNVANLPPPPGGRGGGPTPSDTNSSDNPT